MLPGGKQSGSALVEEEHVRVVVNPVHPRREELNPIG